MPVVRERVRALIINRYLVRELLLPFIAVSGVLTIIFTTYSMTRFLDKAADGLLKTSEVLQLTALKSFIAQEVLRCEEDAPMAEVIAISDGEDYVEVEAHEDSTQQDDQAAAGV